MLYLKSKTFPLQQVSIKNSKIKCNFFCLQNLHAILLNFLKFNGSLSLVAYPYRVNYS